MGWSTHHPVGLIHHLPPHCFRGYTLTTNLRGYHAQLIDMEGRVCHRWHSPEGIEYAYLLPNGHLLLRTHAPQDARSRPDKSGRLLGGAAGVGLGEQRGVGPP